jgi:hypothetical protein
VDGLIDATMKERFAQTKAPKKPRAITRRTRSRKANSRYIPRAMIRAVHQPDAEQCTERDYGTAFCPELVPSSIHSSLSVDTNDDGSSNERGARR